MNPPRQLPVPDSLPDAKTWPVFSTRLTDWVARVAQAFQGQLLRQIDVTMQAPTPSTTGTINVEVDADTDGAARALLVADGVALRFVSGVAPAAGEWSCVVSTGLTTVTLGTAATVVWFAFVVAR